MKFISHVLFISSIIIIISCNNSGEQTNHPLTLTKGQAIDSIHKENITFESEGVSLAGTIYMPTNPYAAVIIVHGSDQVPRATKFAALLAKNNISAAYYHAGLDTERRTTIQEAWIANKVRIIVATNAFGMGIDKPDVRIVLHLAIPESLEAYFQEAGRAGRDEKKAYAVLLHTDEDKQKLEYYYKSSFPPISEIKKVYQSLAAYFQLAV